MCRASYFFDAFFSAAARALLMIARHSSGWICCSMAWRSSQSFSTCWLRLVNTDENNWSKSSGFEL
jgi:hypothetical protein